MASTALNTQIRSSNVYLGLDDRGIGATDVTTLSNAEYEAMIFIKNNVETDLELKDFNIKRVINVNKISLSEYTLKGEDYINKYYYYKLDEEYLENIKKYYI